MKINRPKYIANVFKMYVVLDRMLERACGKLRGGLWCEKAVWAVDLLGADGPSRWQTSG